MQIFRKFIHNSKIYSRQKYVGDDLALKDVNDVWARHIDIGYTGCLIIY